MLRQYNVQYERLQENKRKKFKRKKALKKRIPAKTTAKNKCDVACYC